MATRGEREGTEEVGLEDLKKKGEARAKAMEIKKKKKKKSNINACELTERVLYTVK